MLLPYIISGEAKLQRDGYNQPSTGRGEGGRLRYCPYNKNFHINDKKQRSRGEKQYYFCDNAKKRKKMNSLVYFRSSHNLLFWHPLFCCIKISHSISLFQSCRKRNPCTLSLHHHKSTKVAILFNWLAAAALRQGDHGPIRW